MKIAITCKRGQVPVFYIRWLKQAGFEPVLISRMRDLSKLKNIDALLFSGGGDLWPAFYSTKKIGSEFDLYRDILEYRVFCLRGSRPILGICRGMQLLNVFLGGTLRDLPQLPVHTGGICHTIQTAASSRLRCILGPQVLVNSFHHQAVDTLAPALLPAAHCRGILEAAEGENLLLVQFHPERMNHFLLLRFFKEMAAKSV